LTPGGVDPAAAHRNSLPEEHAMEQPTATSVASQITKMLEQFKLPGIDIGAIVEARRKDIEAVAEANDTALRGVQALNQKQSEILQTTLTQLEALVSPSASSESALEKSAKKSELVQQAVQTALASMRDLAETAYRSQADAQAMIGKRVQENLDELKSLLTTKS
jgi:phasin family protein